jgi:uncharacterized protein (TIGR02246 family)
MDQLQQLLERQAITTAMHRYCRAADGRDPEGFVSVFAEDGFGDYTRGPLVGREALRAFFDKFIGGMMEATQHQVSNIDIDFDDEKTARAVSYVTAWHRFREPKPDYVVHGQYHDVWTRLSGEWLLASRRIAVLGEVHQPRV